MIDLRPAVSGKRKVRGGAAAVKGNLEKGVQSRDTREWQEVLI